MCPLVLAMKPDQGTPWGLSHTSGLSGKTCCLGDRGWPSLGSRVCSRVDLETVTAGLRSAFRNPSTWRAGFTRKN